MTSAFLHHQWKAFWRSKNTGQSIAIRIIMGLLILYLLANILVVGFFLDKILGAVYKGSPVIASFNGFLLYYFLFDLLARFQLQELPTLTIRPYLNLKIRRNQIVNYMCLTSLWTAFNLTPFILTIPFLLKIILPEQGGLTLAAYLVTLLGLTLFNHFFSLWFKRKANLNGWFMIAFLVILTGLAVSDFTWKVISISALSKQMFSYLTTQPWMMVVPVLLALGMFIINYRFLKSNLYLDELRSDKEGLKFNPEMSFLSRFGVAGDLAVTELKLILRNKRSKSSLMVCIMMMFYGLLFYANPAYGTGFGWKIFAAMFMTGIFIISYGQFMYGWQSSHFDGLMVHRIAAKEFVKSKFILFGLFSGVAFILTIPYVYFGWEVLLIQFSMFLWNLGINSLVVLLFANRNYKRIDLSKGSTFNWEGVGATQWLLSIPLFLFPYLIYAPLSYFGYPLIGVLALGFTGLIFIVSRDFWLGKVAENFNEQRYRIAEGFRQ